MVVSLRSPDSPALDRFLLIADLPSRLRRGHCSALVASPAEPASRRPTPRLAAEPFHTPSGSRGWGCTLAASLCAPFFEGQFWTSSIGALILTHKLLYTVNSCHRLTEGPR